MQKLTADILTAALSSPVVIVDFMADWCQPCKPVSVMLERLEKRHPSARFYQANVDELSNWANSLHISSVPTLVAFTNGQPLTTLLSNQITNQRVERLLADLGA